ncbi:MAG: ABC transporter substrate-binding protein [Treponema sp.]|jgi:ABC-type glycerol-3-phosphate transport system substrate-binding protein|nr:ABC transporter substrate-binding protein [Treponema sp.]
MERKQTVNRITALCAAALVFSLAACAKKQEAGTQGAAAKGPVRITVWEMYGPSRNMNKIADAFNKSQNEVYVVDEFIPQHTELVQKVQVAAAAGSGLPDVILVDMFYAPVINDLVGLVDLIPYLASDPSISADDFYDNLKNFSNINGKQISLHGYANNIILYYNKKLFRDAGLNPEKPPVTWNDLVQYAQKMTKAGQWGYITDFTYNPYYEIISWEYQVFVWQNGGEMWDSNWRPTFNTPEGVEALQFMMDLIYKYKVTTLAPPEAAFDQGKAGMLMSGSWEGTDHEAALGDDLGTAALPYSKFAASNTGGEHWMILPTGKEKEDASWKYVSHMLSEPVVTEICKLSGMVPTRKSIADSAAFQTVANQSATMKTSMEVMSHSRMRAASPRYGAASEAMSAPLQQAMYNKISAKDAVAAASEAFARAINGQ